MSVVHLRHGNPILLLMVLGGLRGISLRYLILPPTDHFARGVCLTARSLAIDIHYNNAAWQLLNVLSVVRTLLVMSLSPL